MRFGSVCSGIEAASVAFRPLGWRAAWLSEIEPFPCAVLEHHYPGVPNLGDMTLIADRIDAGEIEAPDMLCGGCPCQSFSVAGLRKSLSDERGNLTLEFIRIADAIDRVRRNHGKPPAWVLYENVPGILSTQDNAFGALLGGLCGGDAAIDAPAAGWPSAGVVAGPARVVAWRVLDAQFFGLAQRRKRVFVLALGGVGGWACADALLPVVDSLSGHPPPSREAGAGVAIGALAGTSPGGGWRVGADEAAAGQLVSQPLLAKGNSSHDVSKETYIAVTHSLTGEGFDASEDGTGRGTPLVPVAFDTTQMTSAANRSSPQPGDPCHPLAAGAHPPAIAFDTYNQSATGYTAQTLCSRGDTPGGSAHLVPAVQRGMSVRRLTPSECLALQGFPRDYLDITYRGKPAADGPKYKATGNSWAVPVIAWIGRRIKAVEAVSVRQEAA